MDAVNFIAAARIRVLLVPVGPIKKATFERHVKMLRQHNSVKLEEVWMGPRTENCKRSMNGGAQSFVGGPAAAFKLWRNERHATTYLQQSRAL
jgi:hypothetical protein